jgi:hypothetical protein
LAGLIFLKSGLFPLVVSRDETGKYIDALEQADAGNLAHLVDYFAKNQLQRFDQALNLAEEVQAEAGGTLGLAIEAIGDLLKKREEERKAAQKKLLQNADKLISEADDRLHETAMKLKGQGLNADSDRNSLQNDYFYQSQAIKFAKDHNYYADMGSFRGWARLRFETSPRTQLLLHFHARGRDLGVVVCAAVFEIIESAQDEGPAHRESIDIVLEPFEFYSTDTLDQAKARFKPWLEETMTLALAQVARFI